MHVLQPVVEPDLAAQSGAHPFQELALDAHIPADNRWALLNSVARL
jgi:hypothetical protein